MIFNVEESLEYMKRGGSSVLLNWAEDNDLWECSWIVGGVRYTGYGNHMTVAIYECRQKAMKEPRG